MRLRAVVFLALAVACAGSPSSAKEGPPPLDCFSIAQTRQKIAQHHLVEPFLAMQNARAAGQGEALSARLCRSGENFFYVIGLLRHDGHILNVFIDAASGKQHPVHAER